MRAASVMVGILTPIRTPEQLVVSLVLASACLAPAEGWAHAKGLCETQAEAEQRARKLGCTGTHETGSPWMPCSHEGMLHKELREE